LADFIWVKIMKRGRGTGEKFERKRKKEERKREH
jgi:hypothetical protein